jgi:hypothetical protein
MAGLVPAIHVLLVDLPEAFTWMPATSAGMTAECLINSETNRPTQVQPGGFLGFFGGGDFLGSIGAPLGSKPM